MNTLLIAGTEAQVGKTVVMAALIAYWQRYWTTHHLGVMKPIDCSSSSTAPNSEQKIEQDCDLLKRLFNLDQSASEITPITLHASQPFAALSGAEQLNLEQIWQQLQRLQQRDFVLLEAFGGLGSPLTPTTTVADLAWDWKLPTLLVVPVRPAAVAHAVANVALARQAQLHLKGIILNAVQPCSRQDWDNWAPVDLIQSLTQKPVLGCVPYLENPHDRDKLINVASEWELERFWGI